jgi:hypothetical protein
MCLWTQDIGEIGKPQEGAAQTRRRRERLHRVTHGASRCSVARFRLLAHKNRAKGLAMQRNSDTSFPNKEKAHGACQKATRDS